MWTGRRSSPQTRGCPLAPGLEQPALVQDDEARRREHAERARDLGRQLPPDAVISHESAAILFGLPTYCVPAAVRVTRLVGNGFARATCTSTEPRCGRGTGHLSTTSP